MRIPGWEGNIRENFRLYKGNIFPARKSLGAGKGTGTILQCDVHLVQYVSHMLQEVYQVTASKSRALAFLIFSGLVQIFTFFPANFPACVFSGPEGGGANYF